MKLSQIASILETEFHAEDVEISGMNTLKDANANEVSFVANAKYIKDIKDTNAAAVIISADLVKHLPKTSVALVVAHSYIAMAQLSKYFAPVIEDETLADAIVGEGSKVSPKAELAKGAVIGKNCTILAHVYIGSSVVIGDNTVIYPNVTIYRDCVIGNDCMIHANSVIGSDGFGFATNNRGEHTKIYQNGNVVLEDDVEIGSNTSIDRAVFGSTRVKKGSRIDNLVQVGHNCEIGEYSVMAAQVGLAGSTTLGRNVVMGGQSASAGHLSIAPFTTIAGKSGISNDIKESGKTFAGFPLMEHRTWLKLQVKIARLLK